MTHEELRAKWSCLKRVSIEHGAGWIPMLDTILTAMHNAGFDPERDRIVQIKEKFATIRIYVDFGDDQEGDKARTHKVLTAMNFADHSASTCEECGEAGRMLVSGGWWLTRCNKHTPEGSKPIGEYYKDKVKK